MEKQFVLVYGERGPKMTPRLPPTVGRADSGASKRRGKARFPRFSDQSATAPCAFHVAAEIRALRNCRIANCVRHGANVQTTQNFPRGRLLVESLRPLFQPT